MDLSPLQSAPTIILIHASAAILVAILSPLQFWGFRKGSTAHRASGYLWLLAMLVVAMTSFWIPSHFRMSIAGYSLIHLLSVLALFSIAMIISHARDGNIRAHRTYVVYLSLGFWIAGAFTLLPGRLIGRLLLGG